MPTPPPDDPLDSLLDRWSSTPGPSPRLNADVWQRIATGERNAGRVEQGPWETFEAWLDRPAFAMGFVAACAVLGLLLAEIRIGEVQRERTAQLARNYLQLIDPLVDKAASDHRS